MSWCVSPWVYPVWDSLCLLYLIDYFLFHVGETFNYSLFKNFLIPFFSSSGIPIIGMLVQLILPQRSLRLSSYPQFFSFFSLDSVLQKLISAILSSSSLIHSSPSDILLLIPSRGVLISVIVLFVSAYLFFNSFRFLLIDSYIFSILFSRCFIIFAIIILNAFSGSLPISSSFIWTSLFLVCPFINLLCLRSPFPRLQS